MPPAIAAWNAASERPATQRGAESCTPILNSATASIHAAPATTSAAAVSTGCLLSATAVIDALKALGAGRIAVAMPYTEELAQSELRFMEKCGLAIVDYRTLGIEANTAVGNLEASVAAETVRSLDSKKADALLISCAQMPSADVLDELEGETGLPVLSTNTATLWAMMRRIGYATPITGYGSLLSGVARSAGGRANLRHPRKPPVPVQGSYRR